jgi:hypothetical protein
MKRAASDTAADDAASSTGPAAMMAAIEADDPAAVARCW